jgi:putative NADH-flavin reductase
MTPKQHSKILREQIIAALQADLADPDYQADIADWDAVVGDGINSDG